MSPPDHLGKILVHKVVILGDGGVGKTAIANQFIVQHFVTTYDPTGDGSYRKQVVVDGTPCVVEVLDTDGQDEYKALRELWIREGEAFLLVFSITSRNSFTSVRSYCQQIQKIKKSEVPLILVGNKSDLASTDREVSPQEAEALAKELNCTFIETSAKIPHNIDETFHSLIRLHRKQTKEQEQKAAEAATVEAQTSQTDGGEAKKTGWRKRLSGFIKSIDKNKKG
ncbi:unnamed protein product [Clonostachys rosea]|uniref:Uncharacterized protein n=1 Tax=Bionectria ochroleuca TaxID=29856 RepID=A0ABY6U8A7_BIOOC|nr:unnamed protein product [Clonostachys rosea]